MREIKFRGKAFFDGAWVYGHYFRDGAHNEIARIRQSDGKVSSVTPSTVGQYTGLKDTNGVEIYEGDIIKGAFTIDGEQTEQVSRAVFKDGCWKLEAPGIIDDWLYDWPQIADYIEVIGDIHDNPELLEVRP